MKPDVIIAMTSAQADAQLRTARDLGYKGVFISTSPLAPEFFVQTAGAAACTDVIVNGMDMNSATPEMKAVQEASMAKYKDFVSDELTGYDQIWTLVQLIQKAGSVDPVAVDGIIDQMTADGTLRADIPQLQSVFHSQASMCGYLGPDLLLGGPEPFFADLGSRPPMADSGAPYKAEISSIEVNGRAASATLTESGFFGAFGFVNYFTLLNADGEWKIISKTFASL